MKRWAWTGALALAGTASAQSLEETTAWLLAQAAVNPPELKYAFDADEFISEVSFGAGAGSLGARPVRKAIPLARVTRITWVRTGRYLSYSLACDQPCATVVGQRGPKQDAFLFEIYGPTTPELVARVNKALAHLVRLHGGEATLAERQAPAEPF